MGKAKNLFKKILNPVRQKCIIKNTTFCIVTKIGSMRFDIKDLNGFSLEESDRYKEDIKRKAKEYRDKYIAIL